MVYVTLDIPTKNVLVDFLRFSMTDPMDRNNTVETEKFNADSSTREFQLTNPNGIARTVVVLVGTALSGFSEPKKWDDYIWDGQNQKVIFGTPPTTGDEVWVLYTYGDEWIYPDKPREALSDGSFPLITVSEIAGTGERLGFSSAPIQSEVSYQIDIWTKPNAVATVGSFTYEGDKLAQYIASDLLRRIEENEELLYPVMHDAVILTGVQDLPFDEESQTFHKVLVVQYSSISKNRITI